jgi:hypothetical protein
MYDPLDFKHGIDVLEDAVAGIAFSTRKDVLEIMRRDLEEMKGNIQADLLRYVIELSMFPEDAVDFKKLHWLNYEVAVLWGSSSHYEEVKSEKRVEQLAPFAKRGFKVVKGASEGGKKQAKWPGKADEMQQAVDSIFAENPQHSYERIKQIASQRHGYPLSALKRYTSNPHRK